MYEKEALFHNYSSEDFTWKRGGRTYTFKAGSVTPMEQVEFDHFAKHLIDRELIKQGKRTNDEMARKAELAKCVGTFDKPEPIEKPEEAPEAPVESRWCDYCTSKGGRHKKDCTRTQEEFAELNETAAK